MTSTSTRRLLALAALVYGGVGAPDARAQGASADALAVFARHELLGNPLGGVGLRLWTRPRNGFVAIFAAERLRGTANRTGRACGGFYDIYDPACVTQPMRDNASLDLGSLGVSRVLLGGDRVGLALTASVSGGSVHVNSTGLTNNRTLPASDGIWGLSAELAGAWQPVRRLPLALEVSSGVGELTPIHRDQIVDGYTPFAGGFNLRRLRLALAWCGLAGGQLRDRQRRGCG